VTAPDQAMQQWGHLMSVFGGDYEKAEYAWRINGLGDPPTGRAKQERQLEDEIQADIIKALRKRGCLVWHADSGSKADPNNKRAKAGRPPVGWPDLQVYAPGGRHHLLEVKRPGEKPRPDQLDRHEELAALGFKVHTITSVAEALIACDLPP
jgi:hypothetical protein